MVGSHLLPISCIYISFIIIYLMTNDNMEQLMNDIETDIGLEAKEIVLSDEAKRHFLLVATNADKQKYNFEPVKRDNSYVAKKSELITRYHFSSNLIYDIASDCGVDTATITAKLTVDDILVLARGSRPFAQVKNTAYYIEIVKKKFKNVCRIIFYGYLYYIILRTGVRL